MLTKARLGLRLLQTPIEDYRKFAVWRIKKLICSLKLG